MAWRNFYIAPHGEELVKVNEYPVATTTSEWIFTGLSSDTEYDIAATTIDSAGNESPRSEILTVTTPTYPPGLTPISAENEAAIDAIVAASMAASKQPGVVLELTGPAGYLSKAYGNTAASGGRPVTTDDHWRIGSNTKIFVAMAVLMQIDAGLLHMDDTLDQWYPQVGKATEITIRHMLSMQSGIPEFWDNLIIKFMLGLFPTAGFTEADAIRYAASPVSNFQPGTKNQYSNSNAVLLGGIVKAVTGRSIRTVILEDILAPLGMSETSWPQNVNIPAPAMSGSQINPELAGAAGAMVSTVSDMTRWAQELRDGTLLSPELHEEWMDTFWNLGPPPFSTPPSTLGYGFFLIEFGQWIGHGGSIPTGFDSSCLYSPANGATIVVANNIQTSNADAFYRISRDIAQLLYPGSMADPMYSQGVIGR